MARMTFFCCAAILFLSACGAPQKEASRLYAKGVKYYYFDAHDEAQAFFQSAADTGYLLPGTYASLGVTNIKQGCIEEGIALLDKEYELYHDPLVKDYIAFIHERFTLNAAPIPPVTPAEPTVPTPPATPTEPTTSPEIAPATEGAP
ncbi:MAG TPA: hypothetical protein PLV42_08225 [bacterium]|nr:hypothetical protein [bacterium]